MSAENYILINRKTFEIFEGCMTNNCLNRVGAGGSLQDALELAEEYEEKLFDRGYCLEYGVFFVENLKGYEVRKQNGT